MNREQFMKDLSESELVNIEMTNDYTAAELTNLYNRTLLSLLDHHAPIKTKQIRAHVGTEWYNDTIRSSKRKRRQTERKWRKTSLIVHYQCYKKQCAETNRLIRKAKMLCYFPKFISYGKDQKSIYN